MAIWFELMVNDIQVGTLSAQRRTGSIHPNSVGTYHAEIFTGDQRWTGDVRHRYGDGAWALVREVITAAGDLMQEVPQ